MKKPILSSTLIVGVIFLAGCVPINKHYISKTTVAPAPTTPYLLLTADRDRVHAGEAVEFSVTFENPSKMKVMLPPSSPDEEGFDRVAYRLDATWNDSPSPINAVSIDSSPTRFQYLGPRESKTFRFKWICPYDGEGIANLKFTFGLSDAFLPIALALKTK